MPILSKKQIAKMKTDKYLEKVRLSVKRVSQLSVGKVKPKH
jgi:DNA-directed RNA polymerase subunit K/omega